MLCWSIWTPTSSTRCDSLKIPLSPRKTASFFSDERKKRKKKKRLHGRVKVTRQKLLHQAFPAFGTCNNKPVVPRRAATGWNMTYFRYSPDWKYFRRLRVKLRREMSGRNARVAGEGEKWGGVSGSSSSSSSLCCNVDWRVSI